LDLARRFFHGRHRSAGNARGQWWLRIISHSFQSKISPACKLSNEIPKQLKISFDTGEEGIFGNAIKKGRLAKKSPARHKNVRAN